MTAMFDPLQAALALAGEFEARGVDYAIGGALALSLWSEPRATNDVDVFVELSERGATLDDRA